MLNLNLMAKTHPKQAILSQYKKSRVNTRDNFCKILSFLTDYSPKISPIPSSRLSVMPLGPPLSGNKIILIL
jgi:hypothetical protein